MPKTEPTFYPISVVQVPVNAYGSALPKPDPNDPTQIAWEAFQQALPRLIAEGHEDKFAVVRGAEIVGIFPTFEEGRRFGLKRYLTEPFLTQAITTKVKNWRVRGVNYPWPIKFTRLSPAD